MEQSKQLVLGFDLSTQSTKMLAVNIKSLQIQYKNSINYDSDLSHYNTSNGVYIDQNQQNNITSNSYMFLEAIDKLLEQAKSQLDFSKIAAISFAGQQHGSIYWRLNNGVFQDLNHEETLLKQYKDHNAFSKEKCPIWMDSSTTLQCRELEQHLGGPQKLCELTGSRAFERFTGNQIAKIIQQENEVYNNTEHISLISSFIAEVFLCKYAQIDTSDGSGMNMLDIVTKQWCTQALDYISGQQTKELLQKLNDPCNSYQCLGTIGSYFTKKYGFNQECLIIASTGDNPSSCVGLGIFQKGEIGISLGTSDTLFGLIDKNSMTTNQKAHIFVSPVNPDQYMLLLCTKNGSLVREKYKKLLANDSWDEFNQLISQTQPGNQGKYGIFIEFPEITPQIYKNNFSLCIDQDGNQSELFENKSESLRCLVESKIMSLKLNAEQFGVKDIKRVVLTGGGSKNIAIQQIISDVFGVDVFVDFSDFYEQSCAYGSCLRAIHGMECELQKQFISFEKVFENIKITNFQKVASPNSEYQQIYSDLLKKYEKLEQQLENQV